MGEFTKFKEEDLRMFFEQQLYIVETLNSLVSRVDDLEKGNSINNSNSKSKQLYLTPKQYAL